MKKSEQFSLYEWIENLNEGRKNFNHESALQALQQLQDDLSLCNNSDNFVTSSVTSTLEVHCSEPNQQRTAFRHVEQPGPLPALVSASSADESKTEITDDELIARNLQYLNGINEDLTGWTMWRRIEGGKEYRYAKDREGRIRWERWFELEPIVIIEPASAESVDTEPTSAESASDLMPEQIEPCYACGERKWWISIYGVRVCGVCHPPPVERLVKEWIKSDR